MGDDIRESRAVPLGRALLKQGVHVVGHDSKANAVFKAALPDVDVAPDVASAFAGVDACIVRNDWAEWRQLAAKDFAPMRRKIVIGGRRILRREAMKGVGLVMLGG